MFKSVDRGRGLELADSGKEKEWAAEGSSTKSSPNFANSPMGHRTHWNLETDIGYGKSLGVGRTQSTEKAGRNY